MMVGDGNGSDEEEGEEEEDDDADDYGDYGEDDLGHKNSAGKFYGYKNNDSDMMLEDYDGNQINHAKRSLL